eukprot:8242984-Pyramimonas_sp.AAC.1
METVVTRSVHHFSTLKPKMFQARLKRFRPQHELQPSCKHVPSNARQCIKVFNQAYSTLGRGKRETPRSVKMKAFQDQCVDKELAKLKKNQGESGWQTLHCRRAHLWIGHACTCASVHACVHAPCCINDRFSFLRVAWDVAPLQSYLDCLVGQCSNAQTLKPIPTGCSCTLAHHAARITPRESRSTSSLSHTQSSLTCYKLTKATNHQLIQPTGNLRCTPSGTTSTEEPAKPPTAEAATAADATTLEGFARATGATGDVTVKNGPFGPGLFAKREFAPDEVLIVDCLSGTVLYSTVLCCTLCCTGRSEVASADAGKVLVVDCSVLHG